MLFLEYIQILLVIGSVTGIALLIVLGIILKVTTTPFPNVFRYKEENYYLNPKTGDKLEFPKLVEAPSIFLSVIIPAFDEEKRLPIMLDECLEYLETRLAESKDFTYEVIVVSDGSKDNTVQVALEYTKKYGCDKIRVLKLVINRGKGGAVRLGMQSARGRYLLFADADGATKFSDFSKLEKSILKISENDHDKDAIAIGSRAHLEEESKASRSFFRTILMVAFHILVWIFAVKKIRDTQCGFKLLSRSSAKKLFSIMHVERWAFDVELLFIAQSYKIQIDEIAVSWTEIEGSKVTPIWSWLQMGRDLILIWFRYAIGAWQLKKEHSN